MPVCRICKNTTGNKSYTAREMMFGYRDKFEYFECAECGCLQIKEISDNLSKYYPKDYYSFKKAADLNGKFVKLFLKRQMAKHCLYGKSFVGMLLTKKYGKPEYCGWFERANVKSDSKILDVGCGIGNRLIGIRRDGFMNLTGIDPFIKKDIFYKNGVKVFKKQLHEIDKQFDFIMLNHSFEHIPNPLTAMRHLHHLTKPNRYILIRIPVVPSFCWRKYGVNWVQLDAPRHLFLHTIKSIQILAGQVGLKVADVIFDSTEFQFWGSEQYLKDIAMRDNNSYGENPKKSIFSKKQIKYFKAKAIRLNKNNDGDSACFYLNKT